VFTMAADYEMMWRGALMHSFLTEQRVSILVDVLWLPSMHRLFDFQANCLYCDSATDRCGGGIMFSGCLSVSACVRPGVCPVSMISYKPVDGISPDFG